MVGGVIVVSLKLRFFTQSQTQVICWFIHFNFVIVMGAVLLWSPRMNCGERCGRGDGAVCIAGDRVLAVEDIFESRGLPNTILISRILGQHLYYTLGSN